MTPKSEQAVLPRLDWTGWSTRFLFFTGKGGVGKTTVAAAGALALADLGRRMLVVSTDPASNLDDVFATTVGSEPVPVPGAERLWAMNIDPEAAAAAYRERVIGPYRDVVPAEELRALEEQLAGQCTVEIAAFDEFSLLLADPELTAPFDHVFFDTAPTGHTLRLLSLPNAWSGYIATSTAGASCLGPLAGLTARREQYETTVAALADPNTTTVVLVSRPDASPLAEAARTGEELAALAITHQQLVVNAVLEEPLEGDPVTADITGRQAQALEGLPAALAQLPTAAVPLVASDLTGLDALRALIRGRADDPSPTLHATPRDELPPLDALVDELAAIGHGAVLVMGKGGVGKTSIAADIALGLARRGHRVHFSTTDPAGDPATIVGSELPESLSVSRIDPAVEVQRYTQRKLAAARDFDEEGRAMLEEDLRSPCTEEIAVFAAFAHVLGEARNRFVVLDTAPTGHTLLLLDTTGAYHREIMRTARGGAGHMTTPLMRLQDPGYTRILLVTLAEATPVQEAAQLQDDLRRAGIEPYGWVVNATLSGSGTHDPVLLRRAALEQRHLQRVRQDLSARVWRVPWHPAEMPARAGSGRHEVAAR
jgi:arsenite-transporting ATPase